jgi:hypothetical protein
VPLRNRGLGLQCVHLLEQFLDLRGELTGGVGAGRGEQQRPGGNRRGGQPGGRRDQRTPERREASHLVRFGRMEAVL